MEKTLGSSANQIQVSSASVLNLKAELSKKESEYKAQKLKGSVKTINLKKLEKVQKKNKGIEKRNEKDLNGANMSELEASWVALQRKAKIYEDMQERGLDDPEEDENLLVDFLMKNVHERPKSSRASTAPVQKGDWTQTVDEFGRTRLVRKEDIKPLQEFIKAKDAESIEASVPKQETAGVEVGNIQSSNLDLHFRSRLERRTMGVGFYQFSEDEATRKSQMEQLNSLRQDTIESKRKLEQTKSERVTKLEERRQLLAERSKKRKFERQTNSKEVLDFLDSI